MKKAYIILFFLTFQLVSCQEKSNGQSIFLGEYTENNKIKVHKNNTIKFINKDSLKYTNQYATKEFIKVIDSLNLYFIASGDEPFWQLKLNSSELLFTKYDYDEEMKFTPIIYTDDQSGFNIMFKSKNNDVFGLIRRIDSKLEPGKACDLGLSDNYLIYEAFLTFKGEVFKGCGFIDEK